MQMRVGEKPSAGVREMGMAHDIMKSDFACLSQGRIYKGINMVYIIAVLKCVQGRMSDNEEKENPAC